MLQDPVIQTHQSASLLGLTDPVVSEEFEAITRLALRLLSTQVALISIVEEDKDRQFFTSQQGLPQPWAARRETPLTHSFCQYVKSSGRPLVVQDARCNPVLCDNPAVKDLKVVAYLGVPIRLPDGSTLGALCVIDESPRQWTNEDIGLLIDLANCVNDEIKLRFTLRIVEEQKAELQHLHRKATQINEMRACISQAFVQPDLTLEERLEQVLQATCHALNIERAVIARVDGGKPQILYANPTLAVGSGSARSTVDGTLAAIILGGNKPLLFHKTREAKLACLADLLGTRPASYYGVPLIFEGVMFGLIEFSSMRPRPAPWSDDECATLNVVTMLACAQLALGRRITRLENQERALLQYVVDRRPVEAMPASRVPNYMS